MHLAFLPQCIFIIFKKSQIFHYFQELQCHFIVTEVPWEDSRALTQNKCQLHNNCK